MRLSLAAGVWLWSIHGLAQVSVVEPATRAWCWRRSVSWWADRKEHAEIRHWAVGHRIREALVSRGAAFK
jgi:hypothetical protein